MLTYRRLLVLGAALFLAGAVSGVVAAQSSVPRLLSHRALYSMSKNTGSTASDITGVSGRLEITFEVACDGWRMQQYIGFRLYNTEGPGLEHAAQLSGRESTDGSEFRFGTRSYEGQELVEELSGVARLGAPGGSGEIHFVKPAKEIKTLPAGTIFPARHVADLIAAARSGKQHLTRTVFDGSTLDSPYEITAFIGAERAATGQDVPKLVSETRSWFFRLAYFKVAALQPSPEFEMSVVLYENGVAGDMTYDYGDFSIDLKLRELEALPVQKCD